MDGLRWDSVRRRCLRGKGFGVEKMGRVRAMIGDGRGLRCRSGGGWTIR